MRATFKVLCLLVVFSFCVNNSTASAAPIVMAGDSVRLSDGPGTTGGGEFTMLVNDTWSFITFCLQRTEYINFTDAFHVDSVNAYTLTDPIAQGGDAAGRDYLSQQTAYLYTMFRSGTLAGYSYTGANHAASADRLQNAFWILEQELPMDASNAFVILANNAVTSGAWSGIGDVRALNLSRNGAEAQDQLALTSVPEPASLFLLGSGLLAMARKLHRSRGKAAIVVIA